MHCVHIQISIPCKSGAYSIINNLKLQYHCKLGSLQFHQNWHIETESIDLSVYFKRKIINKKYEFTDRNKIFGLIWAG